MVISELSQVILLYKREYIIEKVKAPLQKALTILGKRYPKATKENTTDLGTHKILETNEWFLERTGHIKHEMFEVALNIIAISIKQTIDLVSYIINSLFHFSYGWRSASTKSPRGHDIAN